MVMITLIRLILHPLHHRLLQRHISLAIHTLVLRRRQDVVTRHSLLIPTIHLERFQFVMMANLLHPLCLVPLPDLPMGVVG